MEILFDHSLDCLDCHTSTGFDVDLSTSLSLEDLGPSCHNLFNSNSLDCKFNLLFYSLYMIMLFQAVGK